jgi:Xaa-Pro aminopeptidase
MEIKERISKLRQLMKENGFDAYIIPSSDPHISEYVPERWTSRAWISGFNGSAGTVVVTMDSAGLWTDSRYFLQASEQLEGTGVELHKMGVPGVLDFPDWLNKNLDKGATVAFDGWVVPVVTYKKLKSTFDLKGINVDFSKDLIEEAWSDRPAVPSDKIFTQPEKYAGKTRLEKIADIRKTMSERGADHHLVCSLDDLGWIFNIRGRDVAFNPVAVCYGMITKEEVKLFIYDEKLDATVKKELETDGMKLFSYEDVLEHVKAIPSGSVLYIDPARANTMLYESVPAGIPVIEDMNISTRMKAIKNDTEIRGMKNALTRDGAAMARFQKWLETAVGSEKLTELSVAAKLRDIRAEDELFFGESFNTISGYAGHGAIVHYAASPESEYEIKPEGFFLLDSGGQYYDGTTDITRMFYLGQEPTEQEKIDYTLVLKGHILLGMAQYPVNTRGSQIDVLARKAMWDLGINYGHGTGHGVGCFMNVHEGPQNIRMDENPTVLQPGMITSNEPGIYRAGQYGIRIENLVLTIDGEQTEFGQFLKFETLTLCPIDTKAIKVDMLTKEERDWFNDYHQMVYERVSPLLDDEHKEWLKEKTKAI